MGQIISHKCNNFVIEKLRLVKMNSKVFRIQNVWIKVLQGNIRFSKVAYVRNKIVVTKTDNDNKRPQTTTNEHKQSQSTNKRPQTTTNYQQMITNDRKPLANDHKLPANDHKRPLLYIKSKF